MTKNHVGGINIFVYFGIYCYTTYSESDCTMKTVLIAIVLTLYPLYTHASTITYVWPSIGTNQHHPLGSIASPTTIEFGIDETSVTFENIAARAKYSDAGVWEYNKGEGTITYPFPELAQELNDNGEMFFNIGQYHFTLPYYAESVNYIDPIVNSLRIYFWYPQSNIALPPTIDAVSAQVRLTISGEKKPYVPSPRTPEPSTLVLMAIGLAYAIIKRGRARSNHSCIG